MACTSRSCGCALSGPGVIGGSGVTGDPWQIETGIPTICTHLTRPTPLYVGHEIYETDTQTKFMWDGTIWTPIAPMPSCQVFQTTGTLVTNASANPHPFDAEEFDPFGWHSTTTNNERVTPDIPGWYEVTIGSLVQPDPARTRLVIRVMKNGSQTLGSPLSDFGSDFTHNGTMRATLTSPAIPCNGTTDWLGATFFQQNTELTDVSIRAVMHVKFLRRL